MASKAFMFADFKDLIALLNKHKAKYLVVGGYAVSRHALVAADPPGYRAVLWHSIRCRLAL
jgi:hypothetical protein